MRGASADVATNRGSPASTASESPKLLRPGTQSGCGTSSKDVLGQLRSGTNRPKPPRVNFQAPKYRVVSARHALGELSRPDSCDALNQPIVHC